MREVESPNHRKDGAREPPRDVQLGRLALAVTVLILLLLAVVIAFAVVMTRRGAG